MAYFEIVRLGVARCLCHDLTIHDKINIMARHRMTPMLIAALAAALSLLEDGFVDRGGAVTPAVVAVREFVGDAVVDGEDAVNEVADASEDGDGDEIPLVKGAVKTEAPVGKLATLRPHVCGDMASFDVIVNMGVSSQLSPEESASCI